MGTYTTNFSLYKPAKNDVDYVAPFATSMDTIDTELAKVPAGSNTQVQFNDGGALGAISTFIFTKATGLLQSTIVKATSYFRGCMGGKTTIAAGDTTPSVAGTHFLLYSINAPLTITGLDDAVEGQVVTIVNWSGNILTVNPFFYASAGTFVMDCADSLTLIYVSSLWFEISRSANS